ncbi:hypothetical protein [Acinetobacter sp. MD2]|uniref:hypothetical protein n=1 Tax=Acinetobacter sp. MD2 TaxID=2600066 RepID=UPI002D1F2C05|nr:hypothetical protein [Acinetobacter sp. MD2]MEB3767210.1 hypothetical protein [Acinetobacter sp. MD2]
MRYLLISCSFVVSVALLSGCHKTPESHGSANPTDTTASAPQTSHLASFAITQNDPWDIAQFEQFNQTFNSMSQDMKTELEQLKQQNKLSPEFLAQRKRDRVLSALNMLKDLELKTEQGRYIQGLMASFWEQKRQALESNTTAPNTDLMLQAEQQLDAWKAKQPNQP